MSDDEQPDNDGLDALASGLEGHGSEDPDEDLDLARLAAVVGARATTPSAEKMPTDEAAAKVVLWSPVDTPAPLLAPLLAPTVAGPGQAPITAVSARPTRSWLVPVVFVCAIGLGLGGYLLGRSSQRDDPAQVVRTQPPVAAPSTAAPVAPATATAPLAAPPAVAPEAPTAQAVTASREAAIEPPGRAHTGAASRGRVASAGAGAPPAPREAQGAPEVTAPAAEVPPAKPGDTPAALAKTEPEPSRTMDDLLDDALSGRSRTGQAAAPAALPEAPSRDEVTQAMAVLLPAIRGCAMGQTGLATAGIVVRSDGRVASVELSGAPFEGTASGRCMEGVLRRARFSRFRQPTFRVRFPFAIQ